MPATHEAVRIFCPSWPNSAARLAVLRSPTGVGISSDGWDLIEPILAAWRARCRQAALDIGRPPEHELRQIMNTILYVNRTGIAWRPDREQGIDAGKRITGRNRHLGCARSTCSASADLHRHIITRALNQPWTRKNGGPHLAAPQVMLSRQVAPLRVKVLGGAKLLVFAA